MNSDYILNVLETVKFVFCLQIHALAECTMNSKFSILHSASVGRLLCPDIFQFHCACLRTEICLRELTISRTLNTNPKSSRSVDPQFSHKLLFHVH